MLRCPKCGRIYENDTQKFCTHDGGRLAPEEQSERSQAPTAYDLNQTIRTDPFDPEATVTRMPDLNRTVAAAPTSEIRPPKDTGPASAPPQASQTPPPHAPYHPAPPQPPQQEPPQTGREMAPTVAFNQSLPPQPPPPPPPQPYYPQPPQPPPHATAAPQAPSPPVAQPPQPQYAPQQYAPAHYQPAAPPAPVARAKKSSRAPLIIGLVVLLLIGGAAAWYFLIYKKGSATSNSNANSVSGVNTGGNENANSGGNTNNNANANANTNVTEAPPPNATEFVSSSANLDGKLAEYYSDFSFYYPNTWEKDAKAGVAGASNFVKVERSLPPDFTQENFAVSWYESKGTYEADASAIFPKLVAALKSRYEKTFPEFEALSEGETTINGIKGYEFRFQSVSRGTEKGDITLWGRVVLLPPGAEGKKNGITLLMLTTSLAPELASADDVGIKGELPVILNSFKLGK